MGLSYDLKAALFLPPTVSEDTKNRAIKEIVRGYLADLKRLRVLAEKMSACSGTAGMWGKCPILYEALNGKTTFRQEFERLGPKICEEPGMMQVIGAYDIEDEIKIMDICIARIIESKSGNADRRKIDHDQAV